MFLALFLLVPAVLAAGYLLFRTKRGGWLGIPLAAVIMGLLWFAWIDMPGWAELMTMTIGGGIAALAGFGLPKRDRFAAILLGSVATWYMLWVAPSGVDSPVNFAVAVCTSSIAVGALAGTLIAALRREGA